MLGDGCVFGWSAELAFFLSVQPAAVLHARLSLRARRAVFVGVPHPPSTSVSRGGGGCFGTVAAAWSSKASLPGGNRTEAALSESKDHELSYCGPVLREAGTYNRQDIHVR